MKHRDNRASEGVIFKVQEEPKEFSKYASKVEIERANRNIADFNNPVPFLENLELESIDYLRSFEIEKTNKFEVQGIRSWHIFYLPYEGWDDTPAGIHDAIEIIGNLSSVVNEIESPMVGNNMRVGFVVKNVIEIGSLLASIRGRHHERPAMIGHSQVKTASIASLAASSRRRKPIPSKTQFRESFKKHSKGDSKASTIKASIIQELGMSKNMYETMLSELKNK